MPVPHGPALTLRRIGLVVHPTRDVDRALEGLRGWADAHDAELVQVGVHGRRRDVAPRGDAVGCDLVAAVGGDGTVLSAVRAAARAGVPVLGAACGSLGALTAVEPSGLAGALDAVVAGTWVPRSLPVLAVTHPDGTELARAFNDLVVQRAGGSQVTVELEVDGVPYAHWAGDGVAVATQLGSSAYTMALGGPLLAGGLEAMVVTPLAPHGGCIPPLVVPAAARIALRVDVGHGGARVERDGRPDELDPEAVVLTLVPDAATLVRLEGGEPFLSGLRRRGLVVDSPRVLARERRFAAAARGGA